MIETPGSIYNIENCKLCIKRNKQYNNSFFNVLNIWHNA